MSVEDLPDRLWAELPNVKQRVNVTARLDQKRLVAA